MKKKIYELSHKEISQLSNKQISEFSDREIQEGIYRFSKSTSESTHVISMWVQIICWASVVIAFIAFMVVQYGNRPNY